MDLADGAGSDSDSDRSDSNMGGDEINTAWDPVKSALSDVDVPVPEIPEVTKLMRALTFTRKDFDEIERHDMRKRRHSRAQSIYVEDQNLENLLHEAPAEAVGTSDQSVRVVCRFRPVNAREKREEFILMITKLFNFSKKEFDHFETEHKKLLDADGAEVIYSSRDEMDGRKKTGNKIELKKPVNDWTIEDACLWIDEIVGLGDTKKIFRRRKVNGSWLLQPPPYAESKPLELDGTDVIQFSRATQKRFELDGVLSPDADQSEVYKTWFSRTAHDVLNGINTTLFAYGQTGTGKTHTMFGPPDDGDGGGLPDEELGIIPRCIRDLLESMKSDGNIAKFDCRMAILEIYQEKLKDLLKPNAKLQLRFVGRDSKIDNLSWWPINETNEAMDLIFEAKANRVTAATSQNETSSRSHCIITIKIEIQTQDKNTVISKLNFGDLAGSERVTKTGAKGRRLKEATNIVKSLFALKTVIRGLAEKKAFVPYQDSVLTKLLRDSLGGNCFTTIITTASMHEFNRSETVSTLRFAETAKKITNKVEVNRILSRADMMKRMNQMQDQLDYLKSVKKTAKKVKMQSEQNRKIHQKRNQALQGEFQALQINYAEVKKELIELKHDARQLSRELTQRDYLIDFLKRRLEKHEPDLVTTNVRIHTIQRGRSRTYYTSDSEYSFMEDFELEENSTAFTTDGDIDDVSEWESM